MAGAAVYLPYRSVCSVLAFLCTPTLDTVVAAAAGRHRHGASCLLHAHACCAACLLLLSMDRWRRDDTVCLVSGGERILKT